MIISRLSKSKVITHTGLLKNNEKPENTLWTNVRLGLFIKWLKL